MHIQRLQTVQKYYRIFARCTFRDCKLYKILQNMCKMHIEVAHWEDAHCTREVAAPALRFQFGTIPSNLLRLQIEHWIYYSISLFLDGTWKQGHIEYAPPAIFYLPQVKFQTNCIWVWNDSIRFNLQPKVSSLNPRTFPDLLLGQCNVQQDPIWRKSRRCIRHQLQRNTKLSPVLDKANWCKNNCSPDAKLRRHILAADALPANEGVNRFFMDAFLLTSRRDHICIMFGLHQALLQHKTSRLKSMCRLSSSCTEHWYTPSTHIVSVLIHTPETTDPPVSLDLILILTSNVDGGYHEPIWYPALPWVSKAGNRVPSVSWCDLYISYLVFSGTQLPFSMWA